MQLCGKIIALAQKDARHRILFTKTVDNTTHAVTWGFSEWLDNFKKYGIVPGLSIDAKAVANRYGIPLITVKGRRNEGHVCTFFMGFLPGETEKSFKWFLERLKSCLPTSPCLVAVEQDSACIAALQTVVPATFITLDECHLNQDPKKCDALVRIYRS